MWFAPPPWGTPLPDSSADTIQSQFSRPPHPGCPSKSCLQYVFQVSRPYCLTAAEAPADRLLLFGLAVAPSAPASVHPPWARRSLFLLWSEWSSHSQVTTALCPKSEAFLSEPLGPVRSRMEALHGALGSPGVLSAESCTCELGVHSQDRWFP